MPFPHQKSFKTLGLSLCLATALLCSLAVNLTAQEPPAQANKSSNNNDREKSEAQLDPNHMIRAPKNPRFFGASLVNPWFPPQVARVRAKTLCRCGMETRNYGICCSKNKSIGERGRRHSALAARA